MYIVGVHLPHGTITKTWMACKKGVCVKFPVYASKARVAQLCVFSTVTTMYRVDRLSQCQLSHNQQGSFGRINTNAKYTRHLLQSVA
jgi:hypothetical protein